MIQENPDAPEEEVYLPNSDQLVSFAITMRSALTAQFTDVTDTVVPIEVDDIKIELPLQTARLTPEMTTRAREALRAWSVELLEMTTAAPTITSPSKDWTPEERLGILRAIGQYMTSFHAGLRVGNNILDLSERIVFIATAAPEFLESNRARILQDLEKK